MSATCDATSAADADGNQAASASISQPSVVTTNERVWGSAGGYIDYRLADTTGGLRVTFTWRVDSARTAANSTTLGGTAVGRVFARGLVSGCRDCVIEDPTNGKGATVASTFSNFGPMMPEVIALPGSTVKHSIVVRGASGSALNSGSRLLFVGTTMAFGYVGGPCRGTCATAPHSGSASADADLQLLSIVVEPIA